MELACLSETIDLGVTEVKQIRAAYSANERCSPWSVFRVVEIIPPHEVVQTCEGINHLRVSAGALPAEDITKYGNAPPVPWAMFRTK